METTFRCFRRKYNASLKDIHRLQRLGAIEIFQGAYRGHSLRHDRKIRILNLERLKEYFKPAEDLEHEYEYQPLPMAGHLIDKSQIIHSRRKPTSKQWRYKMDAFWGRRKVYL